MIVGNPKEIAISYDVLQRQKNSHFVFGVFNIYIDNKMLLLGGSDWTIDCIINCLKSTPEITKIEHEQLSKEMAFRKASMSRGYWMYDFHRFEDDSWDTKGYEFDNFADSYLNLVESFKTEDMFGVELNLYCEITDIGWRIFIIPEVKSDRIIYSSNMGETVTEKIVSKETITRLLNALPTMV